MPATAQCALCGKPLPGHKSDSLCAACRSKQADLARSLPGSSTPITPATLPASAGTSHGHAATTLERVLGPEHPTTLAGLHALANMLADQDRAAEALPIYQRILPQMQRALGPEHPETLACTNNLARTLRATRNLKGSEFHLRTGLAGMEAVFGEVDVRTLNAVTELSLVLEEQRNLKGAVEVARRALTGFEIALGKDHDKTMKARLHLSYLEHEYAKITQKAETQTTQSHPQSTLSGGGRAQAPSNRLIPVPIQMFEPLWHYVRYSGNFVSHSCHYVRVSTTCAQA